jgi:hypothetical protein
MCLYTTLQIDSYEISQKILKNLLGVIWLKNIQIISNEGKHWMSQCTGCRNVCLKLLYNTDKHFNDRITFVFSTKLL